MANQLDLTSVLYVNSNPLKSAETYSLLTSDILVYEIDNPLYPGINSAVQYYNNTSNQLAYITYYSTKTVNNLLAAANVGVASLVKVPVKSINKIPFAKNVDFLFPANGVQLKEIDTSVTEIYFKGSYYITDTPIGTIIAQANTGGGGGGGTNPTNLFIPYNDAGTFEDSYIKNDTTGGSETLSTIFGGETKGLKFEFYDSFYALGDFGWADNGTSLIIDDSAKVVKTFFQGNDIGLNLDFANDVYQLGAITRNSINVLDLNTATNIYFTNPLGDGDGLQVQMGNIVNEIDLGFFNSGNSTRLKIDDNNQYIKTVSQGNDIGLKLDFANNEYSFGDLQSQYFKIYGNNTYFGTYVNSINDVNGFILYEPQINPQIRLGDFFPTGNGTYLEINDQSQLIKTQYQGNDIGLKLDFANNEYTLGEFVTYPQNNAIIVGSGQVATYLLGTQTGFFASWNGTIGGAFLGNPNASFNIDNYGGSAEITEFNTFSFGGNKNSGINAIANQSTNVSETNLGGVQPLGGGSPTYFQVYYDGTNDNHTFKTFISTDLNNGLLLDWDVQLGKRYAKFGDWVIDQTYIDIDANINKAITLFSDNPIKLNDNGTGNMLSTTAGSNADHLVIYVNGNQYKIQLKNP